jgi:hypothetical protein
MKYYLISTQNYDADNIQVLVTSSTLNVNYWCRLDRMMKADLDNTDIPIRRLDYLKIMYSSGFTRKIISEAELMIMIL